MVDVFFMEAENPNAEKRDQNGKDQNGKNLKDADLFP